MKKLRYLTLFLIALALGGIIYYFLRFPETLPRALSPTLMIVLPILLGMYFNRRYQLSWGIFGIGALTFIGSQVLHIPFNLFLLNPWMTDTLGLEFEPGTTDLLITGILLGLSAGLFEETARLVVFRHWLKDKLSWKNGLMFGAGHGGGEAIILGTVVFYTFLQMLILYQASPQVFDFLVGPDQREAVRALVDQYWGYPWHFFLLPVAERIGAILIHLSLTALVLQVFRRGKFYWYFLAVGWHTLVNTVAVYGSLTWDLYLLEGIVLLMGLVSLGIVFALRSPDEAVEDNAIEEIPTPPLTPLERQERDDLTRQQLEDSRYD